MHLKSVLLSGFKTFAEKTKVDLNPGISVVLGPNGCGKSNFVDAVRWVIGGRSGRVMRGITSSDVIFSGTAERKALGRASVELLFDNSDSVLPGRHAGYGEISVRRDVDGEGSSTYYFNKTQCRRADIIDIFTGTGLGGNSYAVIEQGTVSQLADCKPEELHAFIEEAAGVSRYRMKRRETLSKIDRAKANLERVEDKQTMLAERMKTLKAQALRAEHYERYMKRKKTVQGQLHALALAALEQAQQEVERQHTELNTEVEKERSLVTRLESETQSLLSRYDEANAKLNSAQEEFYKQEGLLNRAEEAIKTHKERVAERENLLTQLETDQKSIAQRKTEAKSSLADTTKAIKEISAVRDEKRVAVTDLRADSDKCEQVWKKSLDALSEEKEASYKAQSNIGRAQNQLQQSESEIGRLGKLLERYAMERAEFAAAPDEGSAPQQQEFDYAGLQAKSETYTKQLQEAQKSVEKSEAASQAAQDELQRLETLYGKQLPASGKQGEQEQHPYWQKLKMDSLPLLVERLCVDKAWVQALCAVLEHCLSYHCVDDFKKLTAHTKELATSKQSIGFVSATGAAHLAATQQALSALEEAPPKGVWLATLLDKKDSLSQPLTGMLHGVIAVEKTADALALQSKLTAGQSVVSREGVWVGPSFVRFGGGRYEKVGDLRTLQAKRTQAQKLVEDAERNLEKDRASLERLRQEDAEHKEHLLQASQAEGRRLERQRQHDARKERLQLLTKESASAEEEKKKLEQSLPALHKEIEQNKAESDKLAKRVVALQQSCDRDDQALRSARTLLEQGTTAFHDAELEYDRLQNQEKNIQANLKQLDLNEQENSKRLASIQGSTSEDTGAIAKLEQQLKSELDSYQKYQKAVEKAQDAVSALQSEQKSQHVKQAQKQQDLDRVRTQVQELSLRMSEQQSQNQHILEEIAKLELDYQELKTSLKDDTTAEQLEKKITRIDNSIERLGAVNPVAAKDYETTLEEKSYLQAQSDDVTNSLSNLEEGLRRIDEESQVRFSETVEKLNKLLQPYFHRLFHGGKISLHTEGDDLWHGGVRLFAQPPGKRNQTIHQLSGGEKTLSVIALIFAIFELNPAPFCLLDEVDASLDDANIGRFIHLLQDVAKRVQVICVSHNPYTMACANNLLGVTLNTSGTSQVLGVNLQEAEKLVEQNRAAGAL